MSFENSGNNSSAVAKKLEYPEKTMTAVEIEASIFVDYVADALQKKGAHRIAEDVKSGKINIEIGRRKAIEMGKLAERSTEKNGKSFDSTEFLLKEANNVAEQLMKKQI